MATRRESETPTLDNGLHPSPDGSGPVTVGVEEEYLLVDPATRRVSPEGDKVVALAAEELGDRVTTELTRYQVEIRTDPHTTLAGLAGQLRSTRAAVARAAAGLGLRAVSSGSPLLGLETPPPFTAGSRYERSVATFGALDNEQSACACHVHIGVPDETTALRLSNHLRPWLPALIALSANSPYWDGHDTGYASWRALSWGRWPAAGPPPRFTSVAHYRELVDTLIASGTVIDRAGIYWDIRPSHHVPTLEVRVADAVPTVADTVLLAGTVKALAAGALTAVRRGEPAPHPSAELLRAACWRAARDGVSGEAIALDTGRLEPATALVERLFEVQEAELTAGDLSVLRAARTRLRTHGNGADRQRAAYGRHRHLPDVVDHLTSAFTAE